jgi:hypothetical protein
LSATAPSSPYTHSTSIGRHTGWITLDAQGGSPSFHASEPPPDGHGFLWSSTDLDARQIGAGTWQPTLKLKVSSGSIVADIHFRAFVLHADGSYSAPVVDAVLRAQRLVTTQTQVSFRGEGIAAAFAIGDRLYADVALAITTNATGLDSADVGLQVSAGANNSFTMPSVGTTVSTDAAASDADASIPAVDASVDDASMPAVDASVADASDASADAPPPPSARDKVLVALFLQYVNATSQVDVYRPNMNANDMTKLRVTNGSMPAAYVAAAESLPGTPGVEFISSADIVANAQRVKDLGFEFVDFNLESGLSPAADNSDVVGAMRRAADAAHAVGLRFRATPSHAYTTRYGTQIAPFADSYHIQAQALQSTPSAYTSYVRSIVPQLRAANGRLEITVQVSTQQAAAAGLSLVDTMEQCVASVIDIVDGASVWYGNSDLASLQSFVQWFHANQGG